jgi:hypothetical protein
LEDLAYAAVVDAMAGEVALQGCLHDEVHGMETHLEAYLVKVLGGLIFRFKTDATILTDINQVIGQILSQMNIDLSFQIVVKTRNTTTNTNANLLTIVPTTGKLLGSLDQFAGAYRAFPSKVGGTSRLLNLVLVIPHLFKLLLACQYFDILALEVGVEVLWVDECGQLWRLARRGLFWAFLVVCGI